jgi:ATP-dependent DNA helicase RecQ
VIDTADKLTILREKFGYSSFRPGQEEVIDAILAGTDALAVMPTGAGKSLCYQIPALMLEGMTIVISPLISLMKDQVSALKEAGCGAAFLNSSLSGAEYARTMDEIMNGRIKLLYIAPERLQRGERLEFAADNIPLVVVDEAHCVSQWGHDFRTSYLQIAGFIKSVKPRPVTAAFTATATGKVRNDIIDSLGLRGAFQINTGFDRPNLYFEVQKPADKTKALLEYLNKQKNSSGIIYCATRKTVEETCGLLLNYGFNATRYHAGLDDEERRQNQDDFIYDRKTVMVATNAFGMGIDKSNVSFVIHYNMPKNMESYYQEAGRAGRDGSPADCILLYSGQDVRINQYLISHSEDEEYADSEIQAHNMELLKQMTFYAASSGCLRRRMLGYFGEQSKTNCDNCSNCLTEYIETDITAEAQKIISCVYRLKQRNRKYGKTMIIDILRGSKNEKIRQAGLDSLSTWSLMSDTSAVRIRLILDYLIEKQFLNLEEGEYPVVTPGNCAAVLREEKQVFMKLPKEERKIKTNPQKEMKGINTAEQALHPAPTALSAASAYLRYGGVLNPSVPHSLGHVRASTVTTSLRSSLKYTDDLPAPINENLLEKLKKLRREIAIREAVPAYIIFNDASLRDMCRKKPVSLVQFQSVNGVGQIKLEKYGETFIQLIRDFLHKDTKY